MRAREQIESAVRGAGFTPRGAFHPEPGDAVPALADGRPAATVLLVGNAGPALWAAFAAARDPARDSLDDWVAATLAPLAADLGAEAHYPHGGPPHHPFQRWAMRAEAVAPSPIHILIHPDHGLWHGYRAALLFAERLALPARDRRASPCESCADRPCLDACPVAAFSGQGYDVPACAGHLRTAAGADCMTLGCRARRACPVGHAYVYAPDQAAFHMRAFLAARQDDV